MLTHLEAAQIVQDSIAKISTEPGGVSGPALRHVGLTSTESVSALIWTIASDPDVGVPTKDLFLDPNAISGITADTSIADLTQQVQQLSAPKLCSNPDTPHRQFFPYPALCKECGFKVL